MSQASADFEGLLRAFVAPGVRFVVVGGVSAALQGVPAVTYYLDLVLAREANNLDRAFEVLHDLDSCFREQGVKPGLVEAHRHYRGTYHSSGRTGAPVTGTIRPSSGGNSRRSSR